MGVTMMKYACVECRYVSYKPDSKDGQTCTCGGLLEPLGWVDLSKKNNSPTLTVSVDVKNFEQVKEVLAVVLDVLADDRIPEEIRRLYADRCSAIEWEDDNEQAETDETVG